MRFPPYITVLAAFAGIASALPAVDIRTPPSNGLADLVDRDSTALVAERATSDISPLETRKTCVTLPRARKLRQRTEGAAGFDDDDVVEVDSVWYVRGDSFLAADEVRAGQNGRSRLW